MTRVHGADGGEPRGLERYGTRFWMTAAVGWLIIAVGIRGALLNHVDTRPRDLATFVIGGALLHDLVFAPLVVGGGALVSRLVPVRGRAPVQVALIVAGGLALYAYPLVRAYGRATQNPTSLPHAYGANLVIVVLLVWLTVAVGAVLLRLRATRSPTRARRPA